MHLVQGIFQVSHLLVEGADLVRRGLLGVALLNGAMLIRRLAENVVGDIA